MYLSYKRKDFFDIEVDISKPHNNLLYKYLIFNNINFYSFLFRKKSEFFKVELRVKIRFIDINIRFTSIKNSF